MNKKGMMVVEAVFAGLFFSAIVAAGLTRSDHIIKRAAQKCIAEKKDLDVCADKISGFSQKERIEYIRDDVIWGNGGNL